MRLKKKNCAIALVIILILLFEFINPFRIYSIHQITNLDYSKSSAKKILEYNLKDKVLEAKRYNEFIDKSVNSKDFRESNYDIYKDIKYNKNMHNISIVNKLIDKKYNAEEISCILSTGNETSIKELLTKDRYDNIIKFLCYDYAKLEHLDRYISYQKETISNYDETVLHVEIGLDNEFYTEYEVIDKFSYDMLINKYRQLNREFIPDDLIKANKDYAVDETVSGNRIMLDNFYKMADELNKETSLSILIRSGYRSFDNQQETYDEYLKLYGQNYCKKYVAYPGFSEHQTGLAVDLKASSSKTFESSKEAEWLSENAYKYGFILRYEKKNVSITGYQSEGWHYRYVGKDIAKYIYENSITLDEYYVKFLNK